LSQKSAHGWGKLARGLVFLQTPKSWIYSKGGLASFTHDLSPGWIG